MEEGSFSQSISESSTQSFSSFAKLQMSDHELVPIVVASFHDGLVIPTSCIHTIPQSPVTLHQVWSLGPIRSNDISFLRLGLPLRFFSVSDFLLLLWERSKLPWCRQHDEEAHWWGTEASGQHSVRNRSVPTALWVSLKAAPINLWHDWSPGQQFDCNLRKDPETEPTS